MIKTVHAGIDGLKVDTQVLKLLRILFVEHYKHTLVIFVFKILLGKVRMTYVGYAVRSEIARSTGCGQICINGYAVSQKFRAARTSNEAHSAVVLWCCGVSTEDVAIILVIRMECYSCQNYRNVLCRNTATPQDNSVVRFIARACCAQFLTYRISIYTYLTTACAARNF